MAGYIGPIPVPQATQTRETFTATASQTTFNTGGYTSGFIDVFMNGVKLAPADFTATNGSDVVLATGAAVGDIIEVVAYTAFEVLNQNFTGDTSTQNLTVSGDLTVTGTTITIDTATAQNVDLGDNDKIRLGDGDDLQIYHNGTASFIDDAGTGDLNIRAAGAVAIDKYTGEAMARFYQDAGVYLYYNGAVKFETTNTGVDVTGNTISKGYIASEATNSTNKWLAYTHTDNTYRLNYNGAGNDEVTITTDGDVGIGASNPGGSKLYLQDTHTTTVTNASTLIGNTTLTINGNSGQGSDVIRMGPMSANGAYFIDVSNGGGSAAYDLLLNPINGGNVGIGTTSPLTTLALESTGGNLSSGNAVKSSTMKGITLNAQESAAHTNKTGVWIASNGSHWSGMAGGRSNSSTWGTDLGFYTHEDATNDLTYSRLRMHIDSEGIVTKPYNPAFKASINSITNRTGLEGSIRKSPYDTTQLNVGNHFSTSNHRFTAPVAGNYFFSISQNHIGKQIVYLYKNGSVFHGGEFLHDTGGIWEHSTISAVIPLSANDYVEAYVRINSSTSQAFAWNGGSLTWDSFSGFLIG